MTTIYTKNGVIQSIQSEGMSIPVDPKNRDYRKIMAQDAITPFERVEIVEPAQDTTVSDHARLEAVEQMLIEMQLGV